MGRCLTTDELLGLASECITGRQARRLMQHCERCAACKGLLDEWRGNQVYAGDVRRALQAGSSVASSEVAVAEGLVRARPLVPLMSTDGIRGYEILGEVHRGGQGVVYRAVAQSTGREVAIKVAFEDIQIEGKRPHRFNREVELASKLKHPSIIAIFDSGTTPDGRCYFVMDYVHGLPVDQYVRERELGLTRTLELFVAVCEAVNHAHQRGVIHRDLKPSNILVDADGVPRVLDFGLAKALAGMGGQFSSVVSVAGQLLGTVPYMAPEQLAGRLQAADIRTDVYALGVLLYEVLSGCLPYDLDLPASDMLRCITEGEPTPPSRRWNPVTGVEGQASVRRRLAGCPVDDELDAIVLRAMAVEPDRRYQSADNMARDVQRYLSGEPVEAKRDRGLYVLRKLLNRYRLAVASAAGTVLLLAVALTVITSLYVKVHEQQRLTQVQRDRAVEAQRSADQRAEELRKVMYLGHISSAQAAADEDNLQRLSEELFVCPADLRGWEWYWLAGQCTAPSRTLTGHQAQIMAISGEAGGSHLLSGSQDGTLRLWDLERMQAVGPAIVPSGNSRLTDICFAPGGERYAILDPSGRITLHALGGQEVVGLRRSGRIQRMAFSPDARLLAVGTVSGFAEIFDVSTGALVNRFGPHNSCAFTIAFSPDGQFLATGGWDEQIHVWNVRTGSRHRAFTEQRDRITSLAWTKDGTRLFSAGDNGTLVLWDVVGNKPAKRLLDGGQYIHTLCLSPDGNLLVSSDMGRNLRFWDTSTGEACGRIMVEGQWMRCLAFAGDGRWLVAAANDSTLRIWTTEWLPHRLRIKAHKGSARSVAFSSKGQLASAGDDGTVKIWDVHSGQLVRAFEGHQGKVRSIAWGPDGSWLVSGGLDQTLRIWDVNSGLPRRSIAGLADGVLAVAVSPDGRLIASGPSDYLTKGQDNAIRIWDSRTGEQRMTLEGHRAGVPALAFSPDGRCLVSGGRDKLAIVWDMVTGQPATTFRGHTGTIRAVVFSPNGQSVLSAGEDNTVNTWSPDSGALQCEPLLHPKTLIGLAVSPDGARRATYGNWGYVNVWPASDVNWALARISTEHPGIWALTYSPDGSCLAASDERGNLWIWRALKPEAFASSPQAALNVAAGARRLWSLRQRHDAGLLFNEAFDMHLTVFGEDHPRTSALRREIERFQTGDYVRGDLVSVTAGSASDPAPAQQTRPASFPAASDDVQRPSGPIPR